MLLLQRLLGKLVPELPPPALPCPVLLFSIFLALLVQRVRVKQVLNPYFCPQTMKFNGWELNKWNQNSHFYGHCTN